MKFMSRLVSTGAIIVALVAPAAAQDLSQLAPADEYFGRFQLSVLGIANVIRDAEAKLDAGGDAAAVIEGPLAFASDAIADWEAHFPNDPWLPPTGLHLMQLYQEIQTPNARDHATRMLHYIVDHWPRSNAAHLSRIRLAQGFPPLHEEPSMRPTISPSPTPTPVGMTPSPSPTPEPTATPTPTPSPTPTPTPRRRHGLLR